MALTLDDLIDGMFRSSAIAGSAYFVVNSGPVGSGLAVLIGAYTAWDSYIYPEKEAEAELSLNDVPADKKEEGKLIVNKLKEIVTETRCAAQVLGALYGTMYSHQAYVNDDMSALLAGGAICMGYCGLFLQSKKHLMDLRKKGEAIYTALDKSKNGNGTKGHKTG